MYQITFSIDLSFRLMLTFFTFSSGNEVRLDASGNYQPIEDKNNQWFGATVVSSGESGHILVNTCTQ